MACGDRYKRFDSSFRHYFLIIFHLYEDMNQMVKNNSSNSLADGRRQKMELV